jgi:hypothetical protein
MNILHSLTAMRSANPVGHRLPDLVTAVALSKCQSCVKE